MLSPTKFLNSWVAVRLLFRSSQFFTFFFCHLIPVPLLHIFELVGDGMGILRVEEFLLFYSFARRKIALLYNIERC